MSKHTRRDFLQYSTSALALGALGSTMGMPAVHAAKGDGMRFGLVTYLWGKDWDLETCIKNCEKAGVLGIEFRVEHAHGIGLDLTKDQRKEIKKRLEDSALKFWGVGSNEDFDAPMPRQLARSIENTKQFLQLSHDIGSSGVKVKPNDFQKRVPREVTIEQIGRSLNDLGPTATNMGQEIRLEVHGQCAELPTIKAIMDYVKNPGVGVCWNCNGEDLKGDGLEHNFNLVNDRFGSTAHVRELNVGDYPYQKLIELFVQMDYQGWILLEARTNPADRVAALIEQRELFEAMVKQAQKKL